LSRAHERYRQTTDDRQQNAMHEFTFAKKETDEHEDSVKNQYKEAFVYVRKNCEKVTFQVWREEVMNDKSVDDDDDDDANRYEPKVE